MGDVISLSDRRGFGATDAPTGAASGAAPRTAVVAPSSPGGARKDGAGACGRAKSAAAVLARSASSGAPDGAASGAAAVIARLEEAGATLLALPGTGYSTRLRTSRFEIVRSALEAFGAESGPMRAAVPSAAQITRMDEALGWIALIPAETVARGRPGGGAVLRRIVGARALVGPVSGKHIYSWRRLGDVLGADHKAVQRWHAQAIGLIVAGLGW